jgi:type IV secretory pathway VirB2 component (pilin)
MRYSRTTLLSVLILGSSLCGVAHSTGAPTASPQADKYRTWIEQMKNSLRGPFANIRV